MTTGNKASIMQAIDSREANLFDEELLSAGAAGFGRGFLMRLISLLRGLGENK